MNRRHFLTGATGAVATSQLTGAPDRHPALSFCDCAMQPQAIAPAGAGALANVGSKVRITNLKTLDVMTPGVPPERRYGLVKLETEEGLARGGEGTFKGKEGAGNFC